MDLIEREDAIKAIFSKPACHGSDGSWYHSDDIRDAINNTPSADRPQGEWIGYEIPSECSVCGHHWDEYVFGQDIWHDGSVPNYCPHCGARMVK